MLKHKAFKFRIYPTTEQAILINKTLGSARFVFNYFLNLKINEYKATGKAPNYNACSKLLTALKNTNPWLKEPDKFSLQNSLKNLENSYKMFFNNGSGFPKFKAKRNNKQSYTTNFTNNNIEVNNHHIKLPKIGKVKYKGYKNNNIGEFKIIKATISKNNLNQYYCSITCEVDISPLPKLATKVGIDLGVKDFATFSNGIKIPNNRTLFKYEHKLKKAQRRLSKKEKGSKNFIKQRLKVAKLHQKVANIREDFLQKVTTNIIRENQIICIEDLSVKNMMTGLKATSKMNKELSNVGLYKFCSLLSYKADWYGRNLIKVNRYYPSSQLCSCCGYKNTTLDLKDREWICPSCNTKHDRDYNASLNILKEGLRIATTV